LFRWVDFLKPSRRIVIDHHIVEGLTSVALLKGDPTNGSVCDSGREAVARSSP
jgi:hypothetical protein